MRVIPDKRFKQGFRMVSLHIDELKKLLPEVHGQLIEIVKNDPPDNNNLYKFKDSKVERVY